VLLFGVMIAGLDLRKLFRIAGNRLWHLGHRRDGGDDRCIAFEFLRKRWNWSLPQAVAVLTPPLLLELVFLGANLLKIHDGGYVPVAIAAAFVVVMWTWRRGSAILFQKTRRDDIPLGLHRNRSRRRANTGRPVSPARRSS
jgi:hypothetical protein